MAVARQGGATALSSPGAIVRGSAPAAVAIAAAATTLAGWAAAPSMCPSAVSVVPSATTTPRSWSRKAPRSTLCASSESSQTPAGVARAKRGRRVIGVDDDAVARPLVAHDLLLRGAVSIEAAVELQVIGPERDHRGERGARAHEGEVGARQLEEEGRPRRVASTPMRSRRSAVGQRFPARAPLLTATSMPARRRIAGDERGRGGLAGGARDADARALPALEQQVAEARDARSLRARSLSTRGATSGVQTSRYAISASPGSASRSTPGWTSIPSSRSRRASRGSGSGLGEPNALPSPASRRASATASGPKPSIRTSTPDHRGSTSFSRT